MFEKYDQLTTAARRVAPVLEPFQVQYLDHLNMTWDVLNKYHFQHYVYSDKLVQENLPLFIAQVSRFVLKTFGHFPYNQEKNATKKSYFGSNCFCVHWP